MAEACKSCGAPVLWSTTVKGKAMPVDPAPNPNGNIVLDVNDPREGPVARFATTSDRDRPHYFSHFATCPNAAQHRKARP